MGPLFLGTTHILRDLNIQVGEGLQGVDVQSSGLQTVGEAEV